MIEEAANLDNSNPAPESTGGDGITWVDNVVGDDERPANEPPAPSGDEPPAPFYSQFPETWRQESLTAAGLDEEEMKYLDRIPDFPTLIKTHVNAQKKIRAGETSTGLPENPTDEQLQAYREKNGIPATPDDYDFEFNGDYDVTDADMAVLGGLTQIAHKHNIPNSAMGDLASAFFEQRQAEIDNRISQDGMDQQQAMKTLKNNWGPDTQANLNITKHLINQLPDTVRDMFKSARMPDGRSVFNVPEVVQFFADVGRKVNPSATITGTGDAMPLTSINSRIEELRQITRDGKQHTKEQNAEYLKLLTIQEEMKGR